MAWAGRGNVNELVLTDIGPALHGGGDRLAMSRQETGWGLDIATLGLRLCE